MRLLDDAREAGSEISRRVVRRRDERKESSNNRKKQNQGTMKSGREKRRRERFLSAQDHAKKRQFASPATFSTSSISISEGLSRGSMHCACH